MEVILGTHCPKVSHSCITSSMFLAAYSGEIVRNVDLDATDNTDIITCSKCRTKPLSEGARPRLLIQPTGRMRNGFKAGGQMDV